MRVPELERRARWGLAAIPPDISPRSHVINTLAWFAFNFRFPRAIRERLRAELGRPPWPEEFHRAWAEEKGLDPDADWPFV